MVVTQKLGCQRSESEVEPSQAWLVAAAGRLGRALPPAALTRFARFQALLLERGGQFNLTSILTPEGVQLRHFAESLAIEVALRQRNLLPPGAAFLDVGSGAGFPGLPIAILRADLKITLIEATRKKADFLAEVVAALELTNVQVANDRAEILGHRAAYRGRFDVAAARAVAGLPALVELVLPFVRVGGTFVAAKGPRVTEELPLSTGAIRACGGSPAEAQPLPGATGGEVLVLIAKARETPQTLPRRPGVPVHDPLR